MRRTTSRSSSRSGGRRASSSRSKRSKRAARPRLSSLQVREILGVLFLLTALLGLLARAGGSVGSTIDGALTAPFTLVGAWGLLVAGLVIGLIVTVHFSPGALIASAVGALRAANAEAARLQDLVAAPPAEKPKPEKRTPAAVAVATPPAPKEAARPWELDEPEPVEEKKLTDTPLPEEPVREPILRVVAEPEDDLPEIEWKLPAITLLDTVTARRERMADEIKRNVRIIETTLQTFGVECKVVGVNPGPAVTQYEVEPGPGGQVKRITALQNDLSLKLA